MESPASIRESQVYLGFPFKILTPAKIIIKITIFEIEFLIYDTLFFKLFLKIQYKNIMSGAFLSENQ